MPVLLGFGQYLWWITLGLIDYGWAFGIWSTIVMCCSLCATASMILYGGILIAG